jgi:hypothetical protein
MTSTILSKGHVAAVRRARTLPQERFSNANSPVLVRCYESHFRTSPFVNSKSTVCYFGMAPNAKGDRYDSDFSKNRGKPHPHTAKSPPANCKHHESERDDRKPEPNWNWVSILSVVFKWDSRI